ncbi:type VI secretion system-associated protein TagF [Tritonibacter scottomollicae]|uniref:Type VI secretion system protein ImpM n=1 Tax=Tritonibacter scottomollicae TaxID=483013 RepID=A0A2T1AC34_TRISK|nr:type VI secretion system-associated protein TagF [Tritonibacter scottomollicae]PRZ46151.1 type VI secretion system protein ImpM [Tritonibacter scottomollicae]
MDQDPLDAARIGLIGKHPGYGDFLRAGLGEAVADGLSGWLDQVLPDLRDELGNDWPAFWDQARELRFWIGRGVFGATLAGVLRPSRDQVGRRYPLLLLAEGADVAPPTQQEDQDLLVAFSSHLDRATPGAGGRALLEGLEVAVPGESAKVSQGPWVSAHHPEGKLEALLHAACPVEADRATLLRSHFWVAGGPGYAAQWLAGPGLPDAAALGWLLGGMVAEPENAVEDDGAAGNDATEGESR